MRNARDENGSRLFSRDQWLTQAQVKSFFSRYSRVRRESGRKRLDADIEINEREEDEQGEVEACRESLIEEIMTSINVCHPIFYDIYNLCEMYKEQKLSSFKITMLKQICGHLQMKFKAKDKKADLIRMISTMVESCSCCEKIN